MDIPTLEHTQRLLWTLITAPEGVAAGLARLDPAQRAAAESLVRGDQRLSAIERFDIYADMYFYRIRDCLKEDFPAVCAVVGEANFHNLVTDYLVAHPPTHFSLRYAGRHLPAFLSAHALAMRWPYVADLAELEWAILDAFDAPDAPPLAAAALTEMPQDRWPELRFTLAPSVQLLRLRWPVHAVWEHTQCEETVMDPHPAATALRVWRQDFRVFHRAMDPAERAALTALANGAPFAEMCEQIILHAGEAGGTQRVFSLLGEWLTDGLLAGCRFE